MFGNDSFRVSLITSFRWAIDLANCGFRVEIHNDLNSSTPTMHMRRLVIVRRNPDRETVLSNQRRHGQRLTSHVGFLKERHSGIGSSNNSAFTNRTGGEPNDSVPSW